MDNKANSIQRIALSLVLQSIEINPVNIVKIIGDVPCTYLSRHLIQAGFNTFSTKNIDAGAIKKAVESTKLSVTVLLLIRHRWNA